jgi:precorrin-8X/cobalt-precorrin-8 methylmutase
MTLFDAYVMVDWSAAARPVTGADSIWIAAWERDGGRMVERRLANPPTRDAAALLLAEILSDLVARGRTTLAGFDFPLGFPAGFAARLDARRPDWRGVWRQLAGRLADAPDNANDRFAAAARMNRDVSGGASPFWGLPAGQTDDHLTATRPADFSALADWRLTERRVKGVQSAWKLYGAGSVGSQALLGIAALERLRNHPWLAGQVRVWPFETGLARLERPPEGRVILAEVWPGLVPLAADGGEVRDAAQMRALCRNFAGLDEAGRLAPLFAGDPTLAPAEKAAAETEEGWILGTAGLMVSLSNHERDPQAITEQSFAIIRAEADLARFPGAMEQVAVRIIHACGMPEVAADLMFSPGAAEAGRAALAAGKPILTDVQMVAHGVTRRRLPAANPVVCLLDDPRVPELARQMSTTRSAAAVTLWRERLDGAVVAIGNAPTALFQLLAMIAEGAPPPAVILGFPVGFVGAAESKEALIASGLPFVALPGRRGGSAMAAAAVNALAGGAE